MLSIFKVGKHAGYSGQPRSTNPYRKGIPGMSPAIDEMATAWENGHIAGSQQAFRDTVAGWACWAGEERTT